MADEGSRRSGAEDPRIGAVLAGKYRVVRPLAKGGMGRVYLARHEALDQFVAVKILPAGGSDEAIQRFRREAHAAAKLQSPHVVTVFDFGELPDGAFFLAMELLRGRDLGDVIRMEAPLDPQRALLILDQIASALQEAHDHGIVHRDLKPENVFLVDDPAYGEFVKVLDFGVSKVRAPGEEPVTVAGRVLGTPGFMAPEQARAEDPSEVGTPADVYAVGCLATELLTGKPAFPIQPGAMMLLAIVRDPPRLPSQLGLDVPGLDEAMSRILSKDPAERPSPRELVAALAVVLGVNLEEGSRSYDRLRVPSTIRSQPPVDVEGWPGSEGLTMKPESEPPAWPEAPEPTPPPRGLQIPMPALIGGALFLIALGVVLGLLL